MIPLKTAIADDDRYICQQIQECLMQYSTQKDIDIDDPDIYTDCATLYNTDFTQKRYDLVFMDIDFSGGTEPVKHFSLFDTTRERCDNGIALGAHLRNRLGHNYFDIIYVTSFENYAIHTIPNRPAALVQKPVTYEKISNALDDALYYRDISWRVFEFTCNNSPVHVQVSKIRYLNSCGRKIYLQTNETTISFYGKLSEVQKKPCFAHFVPIHKSYVVNPDYIDHISANTVYLQGKAGEQLPISRTYQPLVEKWLMQHYLDTNDIDGLRSYISDTEYHLDLASSTTYTQHEQINSILNYKLMPLQLDDTNLDIDIRLPEELPYAPFDLTVLLGNLLDNAAEATEKVFPKEQRHIILKMRVKFGALQLNIRNRYDNILPDESGTRKPNKKRHGLGMKSVQDIVDRYHGKIWTVTEKDWYEVNVILYQPEHSISSES